MLVMLEIMITQKMKTFSTMNELNNENQNVNKLISVMDTKSYTNNIRITCTAFFTHAK